MAPRNRDAALTEFRRAYDEIRGIASVAEFGAMGLLMVFVRATRRWDWRDWPELGRLVTDDLRRDLGDELGPGIDAAAGTLLALPAEALIRLTTVIDYVARLMGEVGTFELILEEFVWDRDVLTPERVAAIMADAVGIDSTSKVYDPFCRAGELLVAAAARGGRDHSATAVPIWGDVPDLKSQAIARMNVRLHHAGTGIGQQRDVTLAGNLRPSRILTNPPFNAKQWTRRDEPIWPFGPPPPKNANFAWLQYVIERLEPGGRGAVIMADNAASSANRRERDIRESMVTYGCVEALISLPPSLFRGTGVPATIWLLSPPDARRDKILFIDASRAGHMASRTLRELNDAEAGEITRTVADWRSGQHLRKPSEVSSAAVPFSEVRDRDFNLSPSVYVPPTPADEGLDTDLPKVRDLLDRLAGEHAAAREKDADAMKSLRNLLR